VQSQVDNIQFSFPEKADTAEVKKFGALVGKEFSVPQVLGEILFHRGFTTLTAVQDFLYPMLSMLPPPLTMKGMHKAVACILETCRAGQPICIHGDYDVDGITATALLTTFFKEIGIETVCYIPNRLEEKYGLSISSLNRLTGQLKSAREGLLITVDCGITAIQEVRYAKELGLRVIITDHHEPQDELPDAEAVLNPKQTDCGFPFTMLAGVGVAFFLIIALRKAFVESGIVSVDQAPNLKKYLDLVALGTVADVVPLIGVNRILVRAGMEILSSKGRYGVLSLCRCCGIGERQIVTEDISYKLAPRINASGRLGFPQIGLALLTAETLEQAILAADKLEEMNKTRKRFESEALESVEEKSTSQAVANLSGLAVYQEGCHPGVLGILASRITDRLRRPVIIFTDDHKRTSGQYLKGSGRSVPGINLFHILEQCSPWIEQYGGHAMAVGLTIKKCDLEVFQEKMHQHIQLLEQEQPRADTIHVDYHFQDKKKLTKNFVHALHFLQPFGEGNPEPVFLLSGAQLLNPKEVKGHLVFKIRENGHAFQGIGFHLAEENKNFHDPVNLVFKIKRSWFKGVERDQIQAVQLLAL
jgi:single-stranded-DNA-specific exonuclease